jgi:hypothetical protein
MSEEWENVITEDVKYMEIYSSNFTEALQTEFPALVRSYTSTNEHRISNKYTSINSTLHLYITNFSTWFDHLQIILRVSYIKQAYVKKWINKWLIEFINSSVFCIWFLSKNPWRWCEKDRKIFH